MMTILKGQYLDNLDNIMIGSPLDQFEVISLMDFNAPILSYFHLTLTNLALFSILTVLISVGIHYMANNDNKLIPSKWSIGIESLFMTITKIVKEQTGREIFVPFIYALFNFILIANLMGNIPYAFTVTTSIVVSIGFSMTILLGVTIMGLTTHYLHFFSFFIPSGTPLALVPLLVLIEFISYAARGFSLGIRLFANMVAGHTLLKILSLFLYQMFNSTLLIFFMALIPFTMFLAILGLELAVSFIQSYVFILLVCSYVKDALDLH